MAAFAVRWMLSMCQNQTLCWRWSWNVAVKDSVLCAFYGKTWFERTDFHRPLEIFTFTLKICTFESHRQSPGAVASSWCFYPTFTETFFTDTFTWQTVEERGREGAVFSIIISEKSKGMTQKDHCKKIVFCIFYFEDTDQPPWGNYSPVFNPSYSSFPFTRHTCLIKNLAHGVTLLNPLSFEPTNLSKAGASNCAAFLSPGLMMGTTCGWSLNCSWF